MSAAPLDRIIDRVRKLHAKAVSCREIGSDAEAEAFASAVQKMLALHKLSMSEIEIAEEDRTEPVGEQVLDFGGRRRVMWRTILLVEVAKAHFCQSLSVPGTSRLYLVGRTSDREAAEYVFRALLEYAERAEAASARVRGGRGHRASFMLGFAERIGERYDAEERELRREVAATGTSLVRLDSAHAAVDAYLDAQRIETERVRVSVTAGAAYVAGARAGDGARLRSNGLAADDARMAISSAAARTGPE